VRGVGGVQIICHLLDLQRAVWKLYAAISKSGAENTRSSSTT